MRAEKIRTGKGQGRGMGENMIEDGTIKLEKDIKEEDDGRGSETRAGKSTGNPVTALFALYVRSSFRKILAVLAGLAVAEGVSFYTVCRLLGQRDTVLYQGTLYQGVMRPEKMLDLCFLKYIFLAALVFVYFILIVTERDRSGCKSSYTLLRLKVSEKKQFVIKTVYNFLCLMLVFALQILAAIAICRLYEAKLPSELVSPQYLFLTFYRNEFLHCILPMADVGKWVCSFLLLLALAMDAACGGRVGNRSGSRGESGVGKRKGAGGNVKNGIVESVWIYGILVQWFVSGINSPIALLYAFLCLLIIGAALLKLFGVIGGGSDEKA